MVDFNRYIDRRGTYAVKYDAAESYLGYSGADDLLPMWVADMDLPIPEAVQEAVIKRAEHPVYGYTIKPDQYYSSIVIWMKEHHDWQIEPEWITLMPGVVPGLSLGVDLFSKIGDKIIVQPPVYYPFFDLIKRNNREISYNQLILNDGQYEIDFALLEAQAKEASMLLLCNPHNPGGRVWRRDELAKIAEIGIKHNLIILSDDIHHDLVYTPNEYTPLASLSEAISERTITFVAPSKTFNIAGLATAAVIISDDDQRDLFRAGLNRIHVGMGNLLGVEASIAAYTYGAGWLHQLLPHLKENRNRMVHFLTEQCPDVSMMNPQGTFLAWLDFRKLHLDQADLKKLLLEVGKIGLNDGTTFGPGGEGFMRLNFAVPRNTLDEGLRRIKKAVDSVTVFGV